MEHDSPYFPLDSSDSAASSLKHAGNRGRRALSLSAASSKTRRFGASREESRACMCGSSEKTRRDVTSAWSSGWGWAGWRKFDGDGDGEGKNEKKEGGGSREGGIREAMVENIVAPIRSASGSGVEFAVWDMNGMAVSMQAGQKGC